MYPLEVGTGTSDIWLLGSGLVCVSDTSNSPMLQENCLYAYQIYSSPSFEIVEDEFFGLELGNGVLYQFGTVDVYFSIALEQSPLDAKIAVGEYIAFGDL
jgi:hypothetical protein